MNKNEEGFIILIAIVISGFMATLGMYISNISYKEMLLSLSTQDSQKAYYAAESVIECAIYYDYKESSFKINDSDSTGGNDFSCNGINFSMDSSSTSNTDSATSIYFVSFANDADDDGGLTDEEKNNDQNAPFIKLEVVKENNGIDTILKAYGHNRYKGRGIMERALEVRY